MDLCVAFGEPSPERLLDKITDEELADWMEYVAVRGLPSHLPFQFAAFQSLFLASKGVKNTKPTNHLLVQKPQPVSDIRQKIRASLTTIGSAIRGASKRR